MKGNLRPYVVKQGDYLIKLAHLFGFDAEEVWKDPKNEGLRKKRPSMDVLAPGDVIHIPVARKKGLPIKAGTTNRYVAEVPKVDVVLTFRQGDEVLASEPCEVRGLARADEEKGREEKTDGEGRLTLKVPVTVRELSVYFPYRNALYNLRVGDMDPESEESGVRKRLANLGFLYVDPEAGPEDQAQALARALAVFQKAHGLEPTGALDEETRKALTGKYGL